MHLLPYLPVLLIGVLFVAWVMRDLKVNKRASHMLAERRERHYDRVDQRMRDLNHRDVSERSPDRSFKAWDASEELAEIVPSIRAGGGWRR